MRCVFCLIALAVVMAFSEKAIACTCINDKLSRRFRDATAIFVGTLADEELYGSPKNVQNYVKGNQVLFVKKAFKGVNKEFVSTGLDMSGFTMNCPWLMEFVDGKDYLVFAYGKEFKINVSCPDSAEITGQYDSTIEQISKLDSFWFRTKARIWPF